MKTAILKQTPGSNGLRFEVQSTPTRGNHGAQKWYIKANHPVEASRWIQALTRGIEWARREAERPSVDSEVTSLLAPSVRPASGTHVRRSHQSIRPAADSAPSSTAGDESPDGEPAKPLSGEGDEDEERHSDEGSSVAESEKNPPHHLSFELHGNSTLAQLELTSDMLKSLAVPSGLEPTKTGLAEAFNNVQGMLSEYVTMVREREEWWKEKLERERERQNVWEESLQAVVKEGEIMEQELRSKSRRRSRMIDTSTYATASEMGTIRTRPSQLMLSPPAVTIESPLETAIPPVNVVPPSASDVVRALATGTTPGSAPTTPPATASVISMRRTSVSRPQLTSPGSAGTIVRPFSLHVGPTSPAADDEGADTDEEDEFFDAIEANNLPNLIINDSLVGRSKSVELPSVIDQAQYKGYEKLRPRLAITSDDRPPMSLWAVLKNSIGKDLTKISFPVFFNEPTSMLQRMVSVPVYPRGIC